MVTSGLQCSYHPVNPPSICSDMRHAWSVSSQVWRASMQRHVSIYVALFYGFATSLQEAVSPVQASSSSMYMIAIA